MIHKRIPTAVKFLFVFSMFCWLVCSTANAQTTFYVKNGNSITKVTNSDPTKMKVTEWQVRLYKHGASISGNDHWGLITGKTAAEVMKKLKSSQDFELRYNAWAGRGRVQDPVMTNFNPLGPIAVVDQDRSTSGKPATGSVSQETWNKVTGIYNEVKDYYDAYQQIMEIVDPKPETPFDNVGDVFREYADNLKEAFSRVTNLRDLLLKTVVPTMDKINEQISDITGRMKIVKAKAKTISTSLNIPEEKIVPAKYNTTTPGQKGSDKKFEDLSEQLTTAFSEMDPNDLEGSMKKINKILKQMADIIKDDPDADPDMKELGRILSHMTETTDEEAQMEDLQKVITLLQKISEKED